MLPRECSLSFAQRDPHSGDAVVLRRVDHESSPSASDVEESHAGLEPELAADVVELCNLRSLEIVVVVTEVGTRVDHSRVEPQLVKVVADVVVVLNRVLVAVSPA